MLRRPRRVRFQRIFKQRAPRVWSTARAPWGAGALQALVFIKLSWGLFELVRLRLAWSLGRRRRGSRRTWFKQQRRQVRQRTRRRVREVRVGAAAYWRVRRRRAFWYAGFPQLPYSAKTRGTRMGKGKGGVRQWYQPVEPGTVFLRLRGLAAPRARYLLAVIARRVPGRVGMRLPPRRPQPCG